MTSRYNTRNLPNISLNYLGLKMSHLLEGYAFCFTSSIYCILIYFFIFWMQYDYVRTVEVRFPESSDIPPKAITFQFIWYAEEIKRQHVLQVSITLNQSLSSTLSSYLPFFLRNFHSPRSSNHTTLLSRHQIFDLDCCQVGFDGQRVFSTLSFAQSIATRTMINYKLVNDYFDLCTFLPRYFPPFLPLLSPPPPSPLLSSYLLLIVSSFISCRTIKYQKRGFTLLVPKNFDISLLQRDYEPRKQTPATDHDKYPLQKNNKGEEREREGERERGRRWDGEGREKMGGRRRGRSRSSLISSHTSGRTVAGQQGDRFMMLSLSLILLRYGFLMNNDSLNVREHFVHLVDAGAPTLTTFTPLPPLPNYLEDGFGSDDEARELCFPEIEEYYDEGEEKVEHADSMPRFRLE